MGRKRRQQVRSRKLERSRTISVKRRLDCDESEIVAPPIPSVSRRLPRCLEGKLTPEEEALFLSLPVEPHLPEGESEVVLVPPETPSTPSRKS